MLAILIRSTNQIINSNDPRYSFFQPEVTHYQDIFSGQTSSRTLLYSSIEG